MSQQLQLQELHGPTGKAIILLLKKKTKKHNSNTMNFYSLKAFILTILLRPITNIKLLYILLEQRNLVGEIGKDRGEGGVNCGNTREVPKYRKKSARI